MHDDRGGRPSRRAFWVTAGVGVLAAVLAVIALAALAAGGRLTSGSRTDGPRPATAAIAGPGDSSLGTATRPTTTVVPMAKSAPVRVQIPAIGVDSSLMALGLTGDGSMQTPPTGFPAGWYTGGPTPGQLGPAVIAGHVDWAGRPGVFFRLRMLKPGDPVGVTRADGTTANFRVTRVQEFSKAAFPTGAVYGNIDHAGLRLITCGGSFDQQAGSYRDDIVAFAELVPSPVTPGAAVHSPAVRAAGPGGA